MLFILLTLLQSPEPRKLSRLAIAGAVLAFVLGVSLLVYFYRRFRTTEKEPDEDWNSQMRSLFVSSEGPQADPRKPIETPASTPASAQVVSAETRVTSSEVSPPPIVVAPEPVPIVKPIDQRPTVIASPPVTPSPVAKPLHEEEATEILGSPRIPVAPPAQAPPAQPPRAETAPAPAPQADDELSFDEDVWAGLGVSQPADPTQVLSSVPDQPRAARVEQRAGRQAFEPPRIERVTRRQQWEPPRIELVTPRDQAAISETRADRQPAGAQAPREPIWSPAGLQSHPHQEAHGATSAAAARSSVRQGSVLGLPADGSSAPLVLGVPARPLSEVGIGALSNYGKDVDGRTGRGGTIALAATVLIFAGALLCYLYIPSVNARVKAWVARARGIDQQAALAAAQTPKAQIIPSYRPEVNKNMVKARGAVDNITTSETLENLVVEVALLRGSNAQPETQTAPVTPAQLGPGQRGTFEFEYDGKRDTGFTGYKILRLLSGDTEVKYTTPGQNR